MAGDAVAGPLNRVGAGLVDRFAAPVRRRGFWPALWAVAVAAELGVLAPVVQRGAEPLEVVFRLIGGSFAACGLIAWRRRPDSRSGLLITAVGFAFLDARLRAHVERAAAGDPIPGDPLRGLYISDDQALALAADAKADDADARLADAAARLGLDALDTAVLGLCAAPELHPRYGRLFAYLHDDPTEAVRRPYCAPAVKGRR